VDVDTWLGTREGVPRLRRIFKARGIRASFFLSLGPDNSGRAIWRVFTKPGFLAKMLRTRAPGAYGLRTLFMGTLLPAPLIGKGQESQVRALFEDGHEVGLHAWDHVAWHDGLWKMKPDMVRSEVQKGLEAFRRLTGRSAGSFAAPAWRISGTAIEALSEAGLVYMSATRGRGPYRPVLNGRVFGLLELPTTLPTADEVLGRDGVTVRNLDDYFAAQLLEPGLHVLTIHAEMEGRGLAGTFERLLDTCLENQVEFVRLLDVAEAVLQDGRDIPRSEVVKTKLPGRPGLVSHQGL
jgi:peptidoglycan/xylan/chitin deacetylase (PgdA/CDA1 family)